MLQKNSEIKRIKFFILLIIPVFLLLVSSAFKNYQGPYFMNSQYDPCYVYLINSLNIAQFSGYSVGHIDHPGTPVQLIGALVIKISYIISGQKESIVNDTLSNPEKYLDEINLTFLVLNFIGLLILGIVSYRTYSNITVSLLLQLTPFTSLSILSMLSQVRPENFLFFVICIFISALIIFINDSDPNSKKYKKYIILIGIISGLGIAAKINFFPLILIPLILFRGIKNKLIFILVICISFLLFVLPAVSAENASFFKQWVYNLFIYNKKYGRGDPTIIDAGSFLYNVKNILKGEWFFDIAYALVFISLILSLIPGTGSLIARFKDNFSDNIKYRLTLGLALTMTLQIIIVAKHYGENYMFPSIVLSVFAVFISYSLMSESFGKKLNERSSIIFFIIVIIVISGYGIRSFYSNGSSLKAMTEESYELMKYIEGNPDNSIVVISNHIPDQGLALFTGTNYASTQEKKYKSILYDEYPMTFYYKHDGCFSFSEDTSLVRNTFQSTDKIYLVCPSEDFLNEFLRLLERDYGIVNRNPEKKFSISNGSAVYEIKFEN